MWGGAAHVALVVKNLPANAGDIRGTGWISRSGRSPGRGNGKYSCLENSIDSEACGVAKSRTWLKQLSTCMHTQLDQIMDHKIQKDQKTQLPFLKDWEQKHVPALNTPLAWPLDTPLPSPHLRNQLTLLQEASKGTCYLFLAPMLQQATQ